MEQTIWTTNQPAPVRKHSTWATSSTKDTDNERRSIEFLFGQKVNQCHQSLIESQMLIE